MTFFRRLSYKLTRKVLPDGEQTSEESISPLVWAALLLGGVLIYLLLTTPILNKKPSWEDQKCFYLHGNGFNLDQSSVLCRVGRLS